MLRREWQLFKETMTKKRHVNFVSVHNDKYGYNRTAKIEISDTATIEWYRNSSEWKEV
jgi:hypothetical protein